MVSGRSTRVTGNKVNLLVPLVILIVASLLLSTGPALCSEADQGWKEFGLRIGFQAGPKKNEYFHQYEAFGVYNLPWEWRTDKGWGLTPKATASFGVLHGNGITGVIGSVGTSLSFNKTGIGLEPILGLSANLLDRRRYGNKNFGSILQFGAYFGLIYRFKPGLVLSYHLQHISNAHVFYDPATPNPGLDMHLFGVSWNY